VSGYLNEYEVEDCRRIFTHLTHETPNLATGAQIIEALMHWTNSNSDGWAYWRKPRQAAARLVDVLDDRRREYLKGYQILDISDAELRQTLVPLKQFLTKQGVDYYAELPWAVILPQRVDA
jgi:hypothetical protein